jgi:hypothetical protein
MVEVPFDVYIPKSCASGEKAPCPIQQYGHGLLGTRGQAGGSYVRAQANEQGFIVLGLDMWGMSSPDVPGIVALLLADIGKFNTVPDRSVQGVLNHHVAVRLLKGSFADDPAMNVNGVRVTDTSTVHWYGISQGGILGAVVVATSPDIDKGHLGVPGAPYPLLLARSIDFDPFFLAIRLRYSDPIDRIMILSLMGALWDRAEPSGFIGHLSKDLLPGITRPKRVMLDYALGDAQVTYLGAYHMARTIPAKMFEGNGTEAYACF